MLDALIGIITPSELEVVRAATALRFQTPNPYKACEALILYEQGVLDFDTVTKHVREYTGVPVETPRVDYIHKEILEHFASFECVPYKYDNVKDIIYVGVLPENMQARIPMYKNREVVKTPVPMHWYVKNYTLIYSKPSFILELPALDIFNFIVNEALELGAADITISSRATNAKIYYNARKRIVQSKRAIHKNEVDSLVRFIASYGNATLPSVVREPVYFSVKLNENNRGRCVINETYHGLSATIRVLPNDLFDTTLEELNLGKRTISFIRKYSSSRETGLRIFVGPTYSGKNTTIAAMMMEMLNDYSLKGVSVEQPVELLMDFLEQLDSDTEEKYQQNIASLLRQNPDVVYVTEITDYTAKSIMNVSNTGKVVITSVHSNTLADVVSRLQDLTGYSTDRVIQNIQSLVYQELVRDEEEDKVYPVNRCIYFSKELKSRLYGKTLGEINQILDKEESSWKED